MTRRSPRTARVLAALAGVLLAALPPAQQATAAPHGHTTASAHQRQTTRATYRNPVTAGVVDTFPDPSMVRGKDGYWYAYGTQNPVFQTKGESGERILPILRSADMTHWEYAGQVFTPGTQPAWHGKSRLWAPDIRYTNGHYNLFYSVADKDTVGVATAPTPTGPWTDQGAVLPDASGCATGDIDEAQFTDAGGQPYLYWGSYDTICVARMNGDGTGIEGTVTEVAQGRRMEGGFVVRRGGYYYLFYSDAGCCDGAFSGYQVKVGRATSPTGPFTDDRGVDLTAPTSKGGVVVGANGDRWIGPGHNAIQTDLSGQDWLVYHAIPAEDPDLDLVPGIGRTLSRRPMLIDRLDWIDGWPVVRAGAGPSTGAQPAPVASWDAGGTFNDGSLKGWQAQGAGTSAWGTATDQDSGGYATHGGTADPAYLVSSATAPAGVRAEADLRVTSASGGAGLVLAYTNPGNHVVAWLDRDRGALVTDVRVNGVSLGEQVTALPSGFQWEAWRNVTAELRGRQLTVEVSADRLHDAVATQRRTLPAAAAHAGRVGAAAHGSGAAADNVGAVRLYTPVTHRVSEPRPGRLLAGYSDDFDGTAPSPAWTWVRGPAAGASTGDGALSWPTQNAELNLGNNTASVLTRPAPPGDFVVETKLHLANGPGNQQAGLVLYGDDDRYFKLVHAVLPVAHTGKVTHVTEFAKEGARQTTTPPTPLAYGPMWGGPTAETLWMRLAYHYARSANEHEVRAATSTDGVHWTWTGAWTLPNERDLRIGLVSLNTAGATARFDYVHTYTG